MSITQVDPTTEIQRKKAQKRARARARRLAKASDELLQEVYKPLEEWDDEELARGRPRDARGQWNGPAPNWFSRQIHEESVRRFKEFSQAEMRDLTRESLKVARKLLLSDEKDRRGRPLVPVSVRWDCAKWLLEMMHGKPTTRIEGDISIRLQAMLGAALVNPDEGSHTAAIDVLALEVGEDEEEAQDDEGV